MSETMRKALEQAIEALKNGSTPQQRHDAWYAVKNALDAPQPAHQPAAAPVAGDCRITESHLERARIILGRSDNPIYLAQLLANHEGRIALTPSPVAPPPIDISSDFCPRCHKLVMREGQFYGINPDAVCKCQEAVAPVATEETQRLRAALEWALKHTMFGQTDEWKHDYAKAKAVLAQPPAGTPEQRVLKAAIAWQRGRNGLRHHMEPDEVELNDAVYGLGQLPEGK